jgi:hypothetical protein
MEAVVRSGGVARLSARTEACPNKFVQWPGAHSAGVAVSVQARAGTQSDLPGGFYDSG